MNGSDWFFFLFSVLSIAAAAYAAIASSLRSSALALWVCGFGVGGVYLSMNAEYLAVAQWILSTLVGINFVFYAVLFGEKGENPNWVRMISGLVCGLLLVVVLDRAFQGLPSDSGMETTVQLHDLGSSLISDHFLSIKIFAVTVIMTLVGAGVISRPDVEG